MLSISESTLSVAICDQFAFYPFRALVAGGLASWNDLDLAEQFVRTVLLHDYVEMTGEPVPAPKEEPEWTDDQIVAGGRNVIVSFLPTLEGYEGIVRSPSGPTPELDLELSTGLVGLAVSSAGTDRVDDPYLRAHLQYLQNLCLVVKRGGSVFVAGDVGRAAFRTSHEMPAALMEHLDADVRLFAEQANRGDLGLVLPPFLEMVIRRAGRRDRIVDALVELREEWGEPRRRVWEILHALRCTSDLAEAYALILELAGISKVIRAPGAGTKPIEVAWQVTTEAGAGAVRGVDCIWQPSHGSGGSSGRPGDRSRGKSGAAIVRPWRIRSRPVDHERSARLRAFRRSASRPSVRRRKATTRFLTVDTPRGLPAKPVLQAVGITRPERRRWQSGV